QVWESVSDPTLMPELSDELQEVEWLDGASIAAVGARFAGRNSHPAIGEWTTTSYVVVCDPPHRFAWAIEDPDQPSATWRFTLSPDGNGTRLSQWMQFGPGRSGLNIAIDAMPEKEQKIVFVRMREHETNMTRTLERIKANLEGAGD
ncbi:MAG TPA: SRPBCC family protein, partial [Acidimicrobiales bacterium]|nr:SRPBCC family protein [Acidimicrobiales bacterium]